MNCPSCGRYGPPDPQTGYDGDDLCPECKEREDKNHLHECADCGRVWECDGADCWKALDYMTVCDNCEYLKGEA